MLWGRRNALDDPVVTAWDAVQCGTSAVPEGFDEPAVAMIASFLALGALPPPSAHFVEQLGQQLSELEAHVHPTAGPPHTETRAATGNAPRFSNRSPGTGRDQGWRFAQAATALLLVLAVGGLFLGPWRSSSGPDEPAAIPAAVIAAPTMEPLVRFDFDPPKWGMPPATTWTHLDFSVISLGAGKSFDTDQGWYTSTDGPLLLHVLDGELTIQPAGPSLLYRGGMQDQPPVKAEAGHTIALEAGDSIAYSIHDAATGSNPGTETMHALLGLAGSEDFTVPGASTYPNDVQRDLFAYEDGMPEPSTAGAHVSLQRLELRPYDAFVFDGAQHDLILMLAPDTSSLYWYKGAFDSAPAGVSGSRINRQTVMRYLVSHGAFTLVNIGVEDKVLYFLVLEPAGQPPA